MLLTLRSKTWARCIISIAVLFTGLFSSAVSASQDPEFRGVWVDTWGAGFRNASEIDALITNAQRGNFNAIIPQVRLRGDAFYNSTIEPKHPGVSPSSFDPLAYLIQRAKAANPPLEVHAWIVAYPMGSSASHPDHILNKHPDWLMQTQSGSTLIGGEYWVDPAHPAVQEHTFNVAMDIISRYEVDGFQLDYIRYPNRDSGYNPISVARFNERFNRSGSPSPTDPDWLQFRRDAVTELVRRIYLEAIAIKPDIKISAATITQGGAPSNFTNSSAYVHRLQDWRSWMQEGILDLNMPMVYYDWTQTNHQNWWNGWLTFTKNHKYDRHLAIGQGWWINTIPNTISQIRNTRTPTASGNRAEGTVGFSYRANNKNNTYSRTVFLDALTKPSSFDSNPTPVFAQKVPVPEMPWKTNPTRGHAKGIVAAENNGQPFEQAVVTLSGPQNRTVRTDAFGFFGAVDLPPGTYTVTASMPNAPYSTESREITVVAGQVTTSDLLLEFEPMEEIVINNTDAIFSGPWDHLTASEGYDGTYSRAWPTSNSSPTSTATYRPNISIPGTYAIHIWYFSGANRAPDAPYTIVHSGGEETIPVDQRSNGSRWNLLATDVHFSGGTDGFVQIGNNAGGNVVIADAVRFTLIEADPDPADFFHEPLVFTGSQSATITWETVGPAVAWVEYGLSQNGTNLSPETNTVTSEHSVSIGNLQPDQTYQLRLHARVGSDTYASNWVTFETSEAVEVIVDNMDSARMTFSPSSGWSTAAFGSSFYGENYHRSFNTSPGVTATFRPDLPVAGVYDVYTWYPHASSYAYNVPHLIQHADGQDTVPVDQRTNGGAWRELITGKHFNAGTDSFVRITNPGNGHTMADAKRWVLRDSSPHHTLIALTEGSGTIERDPTAATYEHGTTLELTATPAAGWAFGHWEGDLQGDDPSATITLFRDREVTAVFYPLYELTTEISGEGTIEVTPDQQHYAAESEVQVLAIPAAGWTFIGWTGDQPGQDNPALLWMDSDITLIANFGFSYDTWREVTFTASEQNDPYFSGPDADPFGHGIPNLLKYAFGMDLRQPERDHLPAVEINNDRLRISFTRLRHQAGIQYQVEISSDLITWELANGMFTEVSVQENDDGRTERVTLEANTGPIDGDRTFVRLRIEPL